jgi:pantothenate kinase
MLFFEIGAVYIRSAIVYRKKEVESIFTNAFKNEEIKFQYFQNNLNLEYKQNKLCFFKINLFRLEDFLKSNDYDLIKTVLNEIKIEKNEISQSINENGIEVLSYYCGPMNQKAEFVINKFFNTKPKKMGHVNQLSIYGLEYIAENIPNSFFDLPGQSIYNLVKVGHKLDEVTQKNYLSLKDNLFPYLFANIMEGTSVYKVEGVDNFQRIGGSTFGATTYWSLVSLTCGYDDPEIAVKDAIKGNNELIDLSVGDIYGGTYEQFSLNSSLIASSFGKLKNVENIDEVKKEDISRSLLTLLCVNISQVLALNAKNSNVEKVIILGNPFECLEFMQMVQMATNYFSGESVRAYFSDYSPYINIIGMCQQMELEENYFTY